MMKVLVSKVYEGLADVKNALYDTGCLDTLAISAPVISVGNLTMGGTGKTPVVDMLLTYLESKGQRTVLVSRNYKAQVSFFEKVNIRKPGGADFYGDEPWMLACRHPLTPVFVGPSKSQSLTRAHQLVGGDVYVVDDGFQHRAFARSLDIVLLDASESWRNYQPLPAGRAREGFANLRRAHLILLTKTERASAEQLDFLYQKIAEVFKGLPAAPVVELKTRLILTESLEGKRVFAFSGLAKPEGFEDLLRPHCAELKTLRFEDHHRYSSADVAEILQLAEGYDQIVTTEKDMVKLQGTPLGVRCTVAHPKFEIAKGEADFYALVDSALS